MLLVDFCPLHQNNLNVSKKEIFGERQKESKNILRESVIEKNRQIDRQINRGGGNFKFQLIIALKGNS